MLFLRTLLLGGALAAAAPLPAQQAPPDLATAYDLGVAALERGDYDGGLRTVDQVLERHGETGAKRFGPAFGHFPYLKGMLLIRKKAYREAIPFLRAATEEYPNDRLQPGQAPNVFANHARVQWGLCLQSLGDHAGAAAKFEEALAQDSGKEPKINRVAVELNLGRCYLHTGKSAEGEALLKKLLDLRGLPPEAMQDAFMALAAESADPDVMALVRQNAAALTATAAGRQAMNPRFANLAARSLGDRDPGSALLWYHLMTSPQPALAERTSRLASLEARKTQPAPPGDASFASRIETALETLRTETADLVALRDQTLLGMAAANFQAGNLPAARALFLHLLDHPPSETDPAQILHNLVICCANLSRWDEAATFGQRFHETYPDHALRPGLVRLLAEISAVQGDPARALALADSARMAAASGSAERESLDYVAAVSRLQQGDHEGAATAFRNFLREYPESPRRPAAAFQLGSALIKLFRWAEAVPVLASFVDASPEDPSRPQALFLLGLAHLVLEEPNEALVRANHLLAQHPASPQIAGAFQIKGDAQAALGESYETVTASYLQSMTAARKIGPDGFETAAYATKQLIALAVQAERWDAALEQFASFREHYGKSVWHAEAVASAVPALVARNRTDEARRLLEELVLSSGTALDIALPAYLDFLGSHLPPPEQLAALETFPAAPSAHALRGALVVARIEILERRQPRDEAALRALFEELDRIDQAAGGALDGRARIRLARWHGEIRRDEAAALRIYGALMSESGQGDAQGLALVDTGRLDFLSGDPARQASARAKFERALNEFDAPEVLELASLGLARLATREERWDEAQAWWERCLDNRAWNQARAEVNYHYALCLDRRGRSDEALKAYVAVSSNFSGQLDWSAPATLRTAELLWNRGRQVDALKVLQDFLRRNDGRDHPGVSQAETRFFQWRDEFAASKKP
jgi:tetratricopeptide (TPR) repeat protein